MAYKLEQIEGIGEAYAAKLKKAGLKTTDDLLAQCATKSGRKKVAEASEISEKLPPNQAPKSCCKKYWQARALSKIDKSNPARQLAASGHACLSGASGVRA